MKQANLQNRQEEWLRVLDKGLITIPKTWREEMGLKPGMVVRAQKSNGNFIIMPQIKFAPLRTFTDEEIDQWVKDDQI